MSMYCSFITPPGVNVSNCVNMNRASLQSVALLKLTFNLTKTFWMDVEKLKVWDVTYAFWDLSAVLFFTNFTSLCKSFSSV